MWRSSRRRSPLLSRVLGLAGLIAVMLSVGVARAEVLIAAAADIATPMSDILAAYKHRTGERVRATFGASSALARQIMQGAPFEIFLAAGEGPIDTLVSQRVEMDGATDYAKGTLVWFIPESRETQSPSMDLAEAFRTGKISRFAIASPTRAPDGDAARHVLRRMGIWDIAKDTLMIAETGAQAAQFAAAGAADGGLIPLSLAISAAQTFGGRHVEIPRELYPPLRQRMVLLQGSSDKARRFYEFLKSDGARKIFDRYGYGAP